MTHFQNIQAILFDLGGVLLNLDYHLTGKAFIDLGVTTSMSCTPSFMQPNV